MDLDACSDYEQYLEELERELQAEALPQEDYAAPDVVFCGQRDCPGQHVCGVQHTSLTEEEKAFVHSVQERVRALAGAAPLSDAVGGSTEKTT